MKRIIGYTSVFGAILVALCPSLTVIPEISVLFPRLTELYASIESFALRLIPDEIEEFVALISEKLN